MQVLAHTATVLAGKEVLGMLSRLVAAALIAAVLVMVIESLPDIKRYLEIREMLTPRVPGRTCRE